MKGKQTKPKIKKNALESEDSLNNILDADIYSKNHSKKNNVFTRKKIKNSENPN